MELLPSYEDAILTVTTTFSLGGGEHEMETQRYDYLLPRSLNSIPNYRGNAQISKKKKPARLSSLFLFSRASLENLLPGRQSGPLEKEGPRNNRLASWPGLGQVADFPCTLY